MWILMIAHMVTLIARVHIAAITSREPPKTWLSSQVGSYSQMVVAFLTAAIFVMCPITLSFLRLMTWPKQLVWKLGWFRRMKVKNWLMATVVHHYSTLEDLCTCGCLELFCKWYYYYQCYLKSQCRAVKIVRSCCIMVHNQMTCL